MRIIDIVLHFHSVSACAALANLIRAPNFKMSIGPHTYLLVFSCLYLAYCVIFGRRLNNWGHTIVGECYNTSPLDTVPLHHPVSDRTYLSFTCFYMFASLLLCWLCGGIQKKSNINYQESTRAHGGAQSNSRSTFLSELGQVLRVSCRSSFPTQLTKWLLRHIHGVRNPNEVSFKELLQHSSIYRIGGFGKMSIKIFLLAISLGQFPVHTYEIFALRHYNEHLLSGDSEDFWGFGQIVALVSVGSTLVQSIGTIIGTCHFVCMCINQLELTRIRLFPVFELGKEGRSH